MTNNSNGIFGRAIARRRVLQGGAGLALATAFTGVAPRAQAAAWPIDFKKYSAYTQGRWLSSGRTPSAATLAACLRAKIIELPWLGPGITHRTRGVTLTGSIVSSRAEHGPRRQTVRASPKRQN